MSVSDPASIFGQNEFLVRRLHSLTGLMPIGGYLVFHLATNGAIIDGAETFQHRADQIHQLGTTTILFLEWTLIFLPILFHGLVGMLIVTRGKRNVANYEYRENWRYTLQRASGVVAFVFIIWHVWHLHGWFRWDWWIENVARPLGGAQFDAYHASETATAAIRASWWVATFYAVGVIASVYHLANGLWTMGITWGVWTSPEAQRRANLPCAAFGVGLMFIGLGALYAMLTVEVGPPPEKDSPAAAVATFEASAMEVGAIEVGAMEAGTMEAGTMEAESPTAAPVAASSGLDDAPSGSRSSLGSGPPATWDANTVVHSVPTRADASPSASHGKTISRTNPDL